MLGQPVIRDSFESIGHYLHPKSNGILLIVVASASECLPALRLVQEIRLNQPPLRIVMIEAQSATRDKDLSILDDYVVTGMPSTNLES